MKQPAYGLSAHFLTKRTLVLAHTKYAHKKIAARPGKHGGLVHIAAHW
jgi:hypothetical protein